MSVPVGIEISAQATPAANQAWLARSGLGTTLRPAFVTITDRTGGQVLAPGWLDMVERLTAVRIPVLPHLTGLYQTPGGLKQRVQALTALGVRRYLVLRGDRKVNHRPTGYYPHATDLLRALHRDPRFTLGAAADPLRHPESATWGTELFYLRAKVQAGAQFLVTQFCFDDDALVTWLARLQAAQLQVPVIVGVLPLTSRDRLRQAERLAGHTLPPALVRQFAACPDESAVRAFGIRLARAQINFLRQQGVGVHLYTFNDVELIHILKALIN
ncbi:methylenetetrahydrofolate reductase [Fructilactobacillus myrtifloralis]|uniref:Methylenetetrahydrofolate reductase n=1 Tax=Fructilactobacillus myrtifloralis TaxID=2940301 RepID=A0ABY5BLZ5_9LACO|nr:methylenetetrahydrofolate reductase [Fructilactobacillus myrtifloralis]USS84705.1 methylenetetrahydrofolate reductase [Fructilactobacillus myrtifloralis]